MPEITHTSDLAAFVSAAPSSYRAAAEVARRLDVAGFTVQVTGPGSFNRGV